MPIKAKPVTAERAALVARGFLSNSECPVERKASSAKKSFYYEGVRERERVEAERSSSSSSSNSNGHSSPPPAISSSKTIAKLPSSFLTETDELVNRSPSMSGEDSDEEALREARRRTKEFLYPSSEKNYKPPPKKVREELVAYEKRRRELQIRREMEKVEEEAEEMLVKDSSNLAPVVAAVVLAPAEVQKGTIEASVLPRPEPPQASEASLLAAKKYLNRPSPVEESGAHADFERLLQLLGEDVLRERQEMAGQQVSSTGEAVAPSVLPKDRQPRELYHVPGKTFADVLDEELHKLYERGIEGEDGNSPLYFVAQEHVGEAFTLAAERMVAEQANTGWRPTGQYMLSMEEIAALQVAERNRLHRGSDSDELYSPESFSRKTGERLNRYFESVSCLEKLLRDPRFMGSVAHFMYDHHKLFAAHLSRNSSMENKSSIESYSHEEYCAFQEFSKRFSSVIFSWLSSKVVDFDEVEFAENLFHAPVGSYDKAELLGPLNVVSYPARRILLAMTDFGTFVQWMVDYIEEEFNIATEEQVVVGGARGLKALVASTYRLQDKKDPKSTLKPSPPVVMSKHDEKNETPSTLVNAPVSEKSFTSQTFLNPGVVPAPLHPPPLQGPPRSVDLGDVPLSSSRSDSLSMLSRRLAPLTPTVTRRTESAPLTSGGTIETPERLPGFDTGDSHSALHTHHLSGSSDLGVSQQKKKMKKVKKESPGDGLAKQKPLAEPSKRANSRKKK